jgi:hypothetical protein
MPDREFGHAEPFLRALVIGGCAWEFVALTTRRLPTVSRLSRRYPVFGAAVLAVLARHFQPLEPSEGGTP